MFHGSSGTGEQFLAGSGWREQADATGLVAVFPTGLRYRVLDSGRRSTKWNTFDLADEVDLDEKPAGYPEDAPWPADDVGFTGSIMRDLGRRLPIDPDRVYASGFSNGGEFAARLAVERSDLLAAAAFSGGGLSSAQAPSRPIPMWLTAGTLDDRILAHTGPPPLTELPLDPVSLLSVPVVDSTLDAHTATLGLDERLYGAIAQPRLDGVPLAGGRQGPGGGVFRFTLLAGLDAPLPPRAQQRRRVRGGAGVLGVLPDPPAAVGPTPSGARSAPRPRTRSCGDRPGQPIARAVPPRPSRRCCGYRRLDREDAHPARGRIAAQEMPPACCPPRTRCRARPRRRRCPPPSRAGDARPAAPGSPRPRAGERRAASKKFSPTCRFARHPFV